MMESKKTAEERWKKVNIRSKKWHQFVAEPLFRNVPLILILVIVIELIDGYRTVNFGDMILTGAIKILCAYGLGVVFGGLEWDFLEKLMQKGFNDINEIKKRYITLYGILFFGLNMTIALVNPLFESPILTVSKLVMFPLSGLAWGTIMVGITCGNLKRFIK